MALWLKQEDGTLVEVSGGGGGSFDGEHVLTGDPDSPPEGWAAGQLLYDGVEDAAGDAGGALTWPLLAPEGTRFAPSYSFSTNGASGTYLAADGSVRIAAEGTDTIGFDSRYITLGGQQQGVGRMSILSGSSGSPVYGFEGDIGTGIYRAGSGVLGVSTGGVERLRVGASSTFKGDMQVDGTLAFGGNWDGATISNSGSANRELMNLGNQANGSAGLRFYGGADSSYPGNAYIYSGGEITARFSNTQTTRLYGDLTVDGNADLKINAPADFWQAGASGTVFNKWGMVGSTMGGHAQSMTSNGYRNKDNKWTSLGVNGSVGGVEVSLEPTGVFRVRVSANFPTGSAANPPSRFTVTESGPTFRAMPSKTRTVDDVLERAETAEYPPEDDEGVATMDGHDEVPLFEVVSALLAKVKELSAEIEELKGA